MMRGLHNVVRLLAIARSLARHDALCLLGPMGLPAFVVSATRLMGARRADGRPGERLAHALQEAGPSFIKLGQALSSRSDLLGDALAADLSRLQDRLPPFPGSAARAVIEAEFGQPLAALFRRFEDEPVAAASIAQVHFAIDSDGREVAVKILRPGIEDAFARDLDLFFWAAERVEAMRPDLRRLRPVDTVRILAETVELEMDLRYEAAAAAELAENFAGDPSFKVPAVDWPRTSRRVLTTERIAGIPIDEREAIIAAGHDPRAVLAKAAEAFFRQVFRDGFFHADLHAGNLFVRNDGGIAAVDFGIMGRLDLDSRRHLGELLLAFLNRDYRRAAAIHFEAGWVPRTRSLDAFTQACRSIAEPILDKPQNEISMARLLGQLFRVTETFAMETQPQLLLLQKTMLVAEGTGRRLCPDVNMWLLARPLVQQWMTETLGPEARLRSALANLTATAVRLPELIRLADRGARLLTEGGVKLHPETVDALRRRRGSSLSRYLPWIVAGALALLLVLR